MPVNKQVAKKTLLGVKIISIFYYIGAALAVLSGIGFLLGAGFLEGLFPEIGILGSALFVFVAIFLLGLAVLFFFIARDLGRYKNWARIVVIVLSIIGVLQAIFSIVQGEGGILDFIISGVIGGYLLFSKQVKQAFA